MSLLHIEPQPNFPREDISDKITHILELRFANRSIMEEYHQGAESNSFLYRLGHEAFNLTARKILEDEEQAAAFSYGISTYEAVSAFVCSQLGDHQHPGEEASGLHVLNATQDLNHAFIDEIMDTNDKFRQELPRTHHVISESAARFCKNNKQYALGGAAFARKVELTAISR